MKAAVFSLGACAAVFAWLGLSALWIRIAEPENAITSAAHQRLQTTLAFFACAYAIWCAYRLYELHLIGQGSLSADGVLEVAGISAFWFVAPPAWFFVEYFAVEKGVISGFSGSEANLKKIKDYADYASKIWAGVLALLIALVTLKK